MSKQDRVIEIHYVDDDPDDLEIFTDVVNSMADETTASIALHTYRGGDCLLDKMGTKPPENAIVLLDINMPLKDGFEVLKDIRSNSFLKTIPVVMYSTSNNPDAVKECMKLGANLYAVKPSSFNALKEIIKKVIGYDWSHSETDVKRFLLGG